MYKLTIEEASLYSRYEWMKEALERFSDDKENIFREREFGGISN